MLPHILFVMMCFDQFTGSRLRSFLVGGSKARASDASASMRRLTHSNGMAVSGDFAFAKDPTFNNNIATV